MSAVPRQNLVEGGFIAALLVLCGGLTALQYHWTGALARAELAQGRQSLEERSESLTISFDEALSKACAQLLPRAAEIESLGRDAAHLERLRAWLATNPRPMFRRMAVAPRTDGTPDLFKLEDGAEALQPMSWPAGWEALREKLSRKRNTPPPRDGPRPPSGTGPRDRFSDEEFDDFFLFDDESPNDRRGPGFPERRPPPPSASRGVLWELPIFPNDGGRELGWLILELDLDYVRGIWLPELIREYLDPNDRQMNDIRVSVIGKSGTPIFTTLGTKAPASFEVFSEFNRQGRTVTTARGLPRRAEWLFEASPRPGVLEAVVAASRRRNLVIAIVVNLLVLAAGGVLLHYTRRSRLLGEAQMAFVANVSHELRTPLTVIRGASHNLRKGIIPDPERVAEYAELIARHAEDLGEMVEQVLSFAATKKLTPAGLCQPVAVRDILCKAIASAEPDIQTARCVLETGIDDPLPPLEGDSAALRRAFRNLIANAAKYGGSGGWIGVKAWAVHGDTPHVEIEIADRGPGIPAGEQSQIFTPFFRGASALARHVRGSGIGLSLAKEIIEAHGGRISLRTGNGPGAVFTIHLPCSLPSF